MSIYYHYTNVDAFFSIIMNQKLWLSPTTCLNDSYEIRWTLNKLHLLLAKRITEKNRKKIDDLWQGVNASSYVPYICAFSRNGDLLSQWRAYANDGYGMALGFDSKGFDMAKKPHALAPVQQGRHTIVEILYNEEKLNALLNGILDKFGITPSNSNDALEPPEDAEFEATLLIEAQSRITNVSLTYKNPAFSEEDEIRIVLIPLIFFIGKTNRICNLHPLEIKHRVSGNKILSYFEQEFAPENLKEIILGPKSQIDINELKKFFSAHGFDSTEIKISKATYR